MTRHERLVAYSGAGGPCGGGYHMRQLGMCSCGWRVEVAWSSNTCECVSEHTADGLGSAEGLVRRLFAKHQRQAARDVEGQGELL